MLPIAALALDPNRSLALVLHRVPQRLIDDGFMLAFMDLPLVPDLAEVSGIGEQIK